MSKFKSKLGEVSKVNPDFRTVILNGKEIGEVSKYCVYSSILESAYGDGTYYYYEDKKLRERADQLEGLVLECIEDKIKYYTSLQNELTK